jgi:hypothetical protein
MTLQTDVELWNVLLPRVFRFETGKAWRRKVLCKDKAQLLFVSEMSDPKSPCVKGLVSSPWLHWEVVEPFRGGA